MLYRIECITVGFLSLRVYQTPSDTPDGPGGNGTAYRNSGNVLYVWEGDKLVQYSYGSRACVALGGREPPSYFSPRSFAH